MCTIALYVDDLFISCKKQNIIDETLAWLKEEFKELTINKGLIHQFTGMTLDFTTPDKVYISMDRLVNELLKSNDVTEFAPTPYTDKLFHVDEASELQDK